MSKDDADTNVRGWFVRHGLPFTPRTIEELENYGVDCVEHLKLVPSELRENLFTEEKPIVKTLAELAWKQLGDSETFEFSRTAAFQKNKWGVQRVRSKRRKTTGESANATDGVNYHSDAESLPDDASINDGFKELAKDTVEPVYEENFSDEMRGYLENVAKHWVKDGHQDNQSRLSLYEAITHGECKKADIARYLRRHMYSTRKDPWNGVKTNDLKYKAIYSTLSRITDGLKNGKLNELINAVGEGGEDLRAILESKSMTPGARGGQHRHKAKTAV